MWHQTFSVALLCSLFANAIGTPFNPNSASRIIGGEIAFEGQYPFVAAINVQTDNSQFFCGGSLIHLQWVLTSGHCAYNAILFTIQVGASNLVNENENRVTVATSTYYIYPDFNPDSIEHDIALIHLRMPLSHTMYIGLVTLPQHDITIPTSLMSLGHGQTSDSDAQLSDDLRWTILTSISNEECRMLYGSQITDEMLCAIGNYNQGTCIGDTGGPLVLTSSKLIMIMGVSSFVSANGCESIYPSGFTRVYPYLEWIDSYITANATHAYNL